MGESKKRGFYSAEFEAKVGLEAVRGMKAADEIGQEHGVHPGRAGGWKREILGRAKTLFEGKRGPKPMPAHQEPELPYSGIGKLKAGLGWPKKSPGSTCDGQAGVDRPRVRGDGGPTTRSGRSIARHFLCAEGSAAGG